MNGLIKKAHGNNKWILLPVICFLLILLSGCPRKENNGIKPSPTDPKTINNTPVRVGVATWGGFGNVYVGSAQKYWGDMKVEARVLDDAKARNAAFVNGSVDVMISSVDLFAQESAKGIPGKIVLVTDISAGGDGIVAKRTIKTLKDLTGKRVAYTHGGPSDYLLFNALQKAGVPLASVKRVPMDDPSRSGEAFMSGAVDAAVTWEPFLSNAVTAQKGRILTTSADYPDLIVDVLVASDKLLADGPRLQKFMEGWLNSTDFMVAQPKEANPIIAKGFGIKVEDVDGMMAGLKLADREKNKSFFNHSDPAQTRMAQLFTSAAQYWVTSKIIQNAPPAGEHISAEACAFFQE